MVFIIPDAYNAAKYARKSHEFLAHTATIERVDFCTEIPLFDAGVSNTILHVRRAEPMAGHEPVRVRRWGDSREEFTANAVGLPTAPQTDFGRVLFRPDGQGPMRVPRHAVPLGHLCYISYGLRANADDRYWKGEFVTSDLVVDRRDRLHPKPFVEGKDVVRWGFSRMRYLEWGTDRAPRKFARPTFPELHEAEQKLIALVIVDETQRVAYDDMQRVTTHTSCVFVLWHCLEGVLNRSIAKTARYSWEQVGGDRDDREKLSRQFHLKYLLAVMNSRFAACWLARQRGSKNHVYPDDWKPMPVIALPMKEQMRFVRLVDAILAEYDAYGFPLPEDAVERVGCLERRIDERVAELYGVPLPEPEET